MSEPAWVPLGGAVPAPAIPTVLARASTPLDVVSTAVETTLFSQLIAAGSMSVDRMLRLTLLGDYLHNNVGTDELTFRVKFGGTTFYQSNVGWNSVIGANRQPWHLDLWVANLGVANSQMISGFFYILPPIIAAATIGIGSLIPTDFNNPTYHGGDIGISTLGAIDTTAAQTLAVTAQWTTGAANNSWRRRYGVLELV